MATRISFVQNYQCICHFFKIEILTSRLLTISFNFEQLGTDILRRMIRVYHVWPNIMLNMVVIETSQKVMSSTLHKQTYIKCSIRLRHSS